MGEGSQIWVRADAKRWHGGGGWPADHCREVDSEGGVHGLMCDGGEWALLPVSWHRRARKALELVKNGGGSQDLGVAEDEVVTDGEASWREGGG